MREASERNVSPVLHFTGSKLGQETKVATLGAMSPREQVSLHPPSPRVSQPSLPLRLTHLFALPQLQKETRKSRGKRRDNWASVKLEFRPPPPPQRRYIAPEVGDRTEGLEGKSRGAEDHSLVVWPEWWLSASHYGPSEKGRKGR